MCVIYICIFIYILVLLGIHPWTLQLVRMFCARELSPSTVYIFICFCIEKSEGVYVSVWTFE